MKGARRNRRDIRAYNRMAWDRHVEQRNPWPRPVSPAAIAAVLLTGFYEDRRRGAPLARYMPTHLATRAIKP